MNSRRIVAAVVLGAVSLAGSTAPARGATPAPASPSTEAMAPGERPLTAAEQARSDAKVAAADAFLATMRISGFALAPLSCVPNVTPGGITKAPKTPDASCAPPSGFLPVEARQQQLNHYCGPAVGQVISNYAWTMKTGANKHSQNVIAGWMKTNLNGQTSAPELATGLHKATVGSPRHSTGFTWAITNLEDTDGDGTTGDQLHGYLMSAISGIKMPIAIPVKPHDPKGKFHLTSWPNAVISSGHWIAAYGWYGLWNGTASARLYYADSSKNQGGGTGKYWNPTLEIAQMIGVHTRRIVW